MAGIYLHIPFCKRRCIYCDFYSTTLNDRQQAYVDALCHELTSRKSYLQGEQIETIYLGGGTPSQLKHPQLKQLIQCIYTTYSVHPDAEITIECNPDDLTASYISMLQTLPFNRISMGIQTFNEETLCLLQRRHTASQAIEAYHQCRESGYKNISIDLMYGLPGETEDMWIYDLQQAIDLKPEHISAYHLTYEEGTPIWELRKQHKVKEVEENTSLLFFHLLTDHLTKAGYVHYEISNFGLPGFHSRHNSNYWTGKKYLGCGAAAHSYDGTSRQWNVASLETYIHGAQNGHIPYEKEELDLYARYNDFVITAIRTQQGMNLTQLKEAYGTELYRYCLEMASPHIEFKNLSITNNYLHLTQEGIFISDGIMSDLLWVDKDSF